MLLTWSGSFSLGWWDVEDVVLIELNAPLTCYADTTVKATQTAQTAGTTKCCGGRGRTTAGGAGRTVATAAEVAAVIRQGVQHRMHLSISQGVLLVQAISSS